MRQRAHTYQGCSMMLNRDSPTEQTQSHKVPPVTEGSFRDLSTSSLGSAGSPTHSLQTERIDWKPDQ